MARTLASAVLVVLSVVACGIVSTTPPAPTPADFPGITSELARRGVRVGGIVAGDAGCPDPTLARTAIRFTVSGLDQADPVPVYVYIFRNQDAYDRRRADVDICAQSYVTDPETFISIDAPPFVLAGQGPWAPELAEAMRVGLQAAAGAGP